MRSDVCRSDDRRRADVDPNADQHSVSHGFDQKSGDLLPSDQQVVRPLDRGVDSSKQKTVRNGKRRAGRNQVAGGEDQRRVQAADRRAPTPSASSTSCCLRLGHDDLGARFDRQQRSRDVLGRSRGIEFHDLRIFTFAHLADCTPS